MSRPPLPDYDPQPDEPFTEEEKAIIATALSILPHLGADATAQYLDKAVNHGGRPEHEA